MTQMVAIPFTQYLRPNGRKFQTSIERPKEIADKAFKLIDSGYRFEAEILTTGQVSFTIHDIAEEEDVAIEICANGPLVPSAVDRLIAKFENGAVCKDDICGWYGPVAELQAGHCPKCGSVEIEHCERPL